METAFFELWDKALNVSPFLYFDMGYHKQNGYTLAMSAKRSVYDRWNNAFFQGESFDRNHLFAQAYVALVDYLETKCGGY